MHVRDPDRAVLAIVEGAHHGVLPDDPEATLPEVCYNFWPPKCCELSRNRHRIPIAISSPTGRGYRASRAMIVAQWAAGFCAVATSTHLASIAIAGLRCRRRNAPHGMSSPAPPVTVLRPVCGTEPFVRETLG